MAKDKACSDQDGVVSDCTWCGADGRCKLGAAQQRRRERLQNLPDGLLKTVQEEVEEKVFSQRRECIGDFDLIWEHFGKIERAIRKYTGDQDFPIVR